MIVHVGPSHLPLPARLGGAIERRMIELAEAQARGGEQVIVYSGGAETGWRKYRGVWIRYLSGSRTDFALRFVLDVVSHTPRVIHVHNRAEIAWLAKATGRGPIVLSCDYHFEPWRRFPHLRTLSKAVWRQCLLASDCIAPVSDYCREMFQGYWNLPDGKLTPIPNGVDCARFRPDSALRAEWRARLGLDARPMILYVGRLCEQKGTDLLAAAYRRLKRPATLVLAGPCEQFGTTRLNALAAQVQEAGGVYLPPLDDADMPGIYNACDIFVMPTRELEMFGMAAVEAQACGKPVVASDHGGLRETVPVSAGVRFRTGDAMDLAAHLEALLGNPDLLSALATGARESAERYDWPGIAQHCNEVYATL
ncbi:MAG TPA: glycosyltransferase family 4 protein [Bryobacteraceae bacterium]|jgi:glycosyltransferase involved in cell wall biosynthesis|nr:glycosyltransferase family 4 protein [Bryobacteraceae bacterium]